MREPAFCSWRRARIKLGELRGQPPIPSAYRLTEPGVGKYQKRWGLSFQRPDMRAVEQDPEAVRRRHQETWPKTGAKVKEDGGEILFADQVGIRSDQVTGRTWDEKGRTPVVRRSGNRFSVNAMSAISTKGRMRFMVFTEHTSPPR